MNSSGGCNIPTEKKTKCNNCTTKLQLLTMKAECNNLDLVIDNG